MVLDNYELGERIGSIFLFLLFVYLGYKTGRWFWFKINKKIKCNKN